MYVRGWEMVEILMVEHWKVRFFCLLTKIVMKNIGLCQFLCYFVVSRKRVEITGVNSRYC